MVLTNPPPPPRQTAKKAAQGAEKSRNPLSLVPSLPAGLHAFYSDSECLTRFTKCVPRFEKYGKSFETAQHVAKKYFRVRNTDRKIFLRLLNALGKIFYYA